MKNSYSSFWFLPFGYGRKRMLSFIHGPVYGYGKTASATFVLLAAWLGLSQSTYGQASAVLDANEVRATVSANNSLFWDLMSSPKYEVPKGSGNNTMFVGNLWLVGQDVGSGTLRGFADRYGASGFDLHTGPLTVDGTAQTDSATVQAFDRVWKLNRADVEALQAAQANGSLVAGTYTPPTDILQWPGNGPTGYAATLAPFYDANGDGHYDVYDGDCPLMKGDQMLYWILNDGYGLHPETQLEHMGAEIHVSFYACKNPGATGDGDIMNYTTFLEYLIINRSTVTYHNLYAGFNTDCDIGYPGDDYVGSHVDVDAFYFYNGDSIDGQGSTPLAGQYGANSPVQSIQFLASPIEDGRYMSRFMSYANSSGVAGDPEVGQGPQFYNFLRGFFKDGASLVYGGNGYPGSIGATSIPTHYTYPGVSDSSLQGTGSVDPGFEWTQQYPCPACVQNAAADQRGVGSTGPFFLAPGDEKRLTLVLISTFDSTQSITERVELNRAQNKTVRSWFYGNSFPCEMTQNDLGTDEVVAESPLSVYPNPAATLVRVSGAGIKPGTGYAVLDINGRTLLSGKSQLDGMLEVDAEALSAGIYFIRLDSVAGARRIVKFVKQ